MKAWLLAGLLLWTAVAQAQSMFRGDASRRGVAPAGATLAGAPKTVKWSFATGARIVSSPVWHARPDLLRQRRWPCLRPGRRAGAPDLALAHRWPGAIDTGGT
jgi:hypothetical protein